MQASVLKDKSFLFSVKIVRHMNGIQTVKKKFVMTSAVDPVWDSNRSIKRESEFAQSKPDFINKLSIALKEGNEAA